MRSRDIFDALRAGRIDREEAARLLAQVAGDSARPAVASTPDARADTGLPAQASMAPASAGISTPTTRASAYPPKIAIIGSSGRYPQAPDLDAYWNNLAAGRHSVAPIPRERWDVDACYDPRRGEPGKVYCRWLAALDDIDAFDSLFFRISPAEAEYIDPQHRLFLQEAYRALEDAGYSPRKLDGSRCGVYMGIMSNEYAMMLARDGADIVNATGNAFSIAAARLSYHLNLKGPAVAIDTACSSSLVSLHLACQALRVGEIDMALAGGVSLYLTAESYIAMCSAGMLAEDGACKAFDDRADGFVPGEGVGCVVLKRLEDAERDGDRILGVILATGTNQDGRTNGITAPSGVSQAQLVRAVYAGFGIRATDIDYCEMHGTGTRLGDPVELNALGEVYREAGVSTGACAIGSVKSNIGHTSAAAGVAGLQKILLSFEHAAIPPVANFRTPNAHYDFASSPFRVATEAVPWVAGERPRRAAISSFGLSGTNAHAVIEAYPVRENAYDQGGGAPALIVLSAMNAQALARYRAALLAQINRDPQINLVDLAYTLQTGRAEFDYRWAARIDGVQALRLALQADGPGPDRWSGRTDHAATPSAYAPPPAVMHDPAMLWAQAAEAWVRGVSVDWPALHQRLGTAPRRARAPTYPFAKARHWLPGKTLGVPLRRTALLRLGWVDAPLPTTPIDGTATDACILTSLSDAASRDLAEALLAAMPGARLFDVDAFDETALPDLLPLVVDLAPQHGAELFPGQWIAAIQALMRRKPKRMLGVSFAHAPGIAIVDDLFSAMHAAFYRSLRAEHPDIAASCLELPRGTMPDRSVSWVLEEACAGNGQLHARHGETGRQTTRFEVIDDASATVAPPLDADDHVWITGGTRGIGLLCAVHLARTRGVRRFLLSGRSLPPIDGAAPSEPAEQRRATLLAELAALGARIRWSTVSLDDAAALAHEIDAAVAVHGPIRMLLHCAGLSDWTQPSFAAKPLSAIGDVLSPKTKGALCVLGALASQPLKCAVLFSSVAAAVPTLAAGALDYAMANACLDRIATLRTGAMPIVSLQWPNWRATGMGEVRSRAYLDSGLASLEDEEGLAVLDRVLNTRLPDAVVLPAVLASAGEPWTDWLLPRRSAAREAGPDVSTRIGGIGTQARTVPDDSDLVVSTRAWLVSTFADELKLGTIALEIDRPLHEYGVDSIMLTQLLRPLNRHAERPLDPSLLYEYDSIAKLADALLSNHRDMLERASIVPPAATAGKEPTAHGAPATAATLAAAPIGRRERAGDDDIAIVGLACRFPQAPDPGAYWSLLRDGRCAIDAVPRRRWSAASSFHAGCIEPIDAFDHAYFGLSHADAAAMDTQALLLLELCAELFHDAGHTLADMKGRNIGVYLGGRSAHRPSASVLSASAHPIRAVGQNYLASNLSQCFDLHGPSLLVDTACSSALVAMQSAAMALRSGSVEAAVVGGVSLLDNDEGHRLFAQRGLLAAGADFHIFDARANGIVLGEGGGLAMLKPLSVAQADGDRIHAVLRGIAVNNDGRTAGPSSPNFAAMKDVMRIAIERSGIAPDKMRYIEANGSGSVVTDLLELKAIDAVYGLQREGCEVGSVKPNIGHTLCAEGMAAFIKVVLMLQHRSGVPYLSGTQPMPHFTGAGDGRLFARTATTWTEPVSVASISSFADGGTNAHVVLSSAATSSATHDPLPPPVFRRQTLRERDRAQDSIWRRAPAHRPKMPLES